MKKTFANIRTLAALLIASAALAACSNDDGAIIGEQPAQQQAPQVYTLTLQAGKADNAQTRALALDGTRLVAKWVAGEEVTVTKGTTSLGTLSVKEGSVSADGQTCTFTGTLTGNIATDDVLTLTYHPVASTDYSSQTGTLESAAACDMATASVTVTAVDNGKNTITAGTAVFETKTAVLKITLQDGVGSALNASKLTISAGGTDIFTLTSIATSGFLYLALPSAERVAAAKGMTTEELAALPITFTATAGGNTYIATKTGYPFAAGKYYATTLTMAKVVAYSSEINVPAGDHWYIGGSGTDNITIGEGATVTIGSHLQMQYASIICSGNATIILADGTITKITDGRIKAGPENTTLTIKGNTGELDIEARNSSGAAIGASDGAACGNIVIEGGIITAKGAMAAGIGASNAKCGNIVIKGGEITATGGANGGAGIGGGNEGSCGNIEISGGTVTATGGTNAGAGIGGGNEGSCGNIEISGGTITATGGANAGAGIGGCDNGTCGTITISGGTVVAEGGTDGAGIGGGYEGTCGKITINGGTVKAKGGSDAAGIGSGSGYDSEVGASCGTITITSGVTSVTATKGSDAPNSIGAGHDGTCGTVTIDGVANATTSSTFTNFNSSVSGNTWTLTHK